MSHFDINTLEKELKELENQTANPDFWNGNQNTNSVLAKIKSLKNKCSTYTNWNNEIDNLIELLQLLQLEYDEEMEK